MAKDKERSVNPAQQQRKLEKAKALKKSKAELQSRRNEKLARRNPDRIQRQIDDLKALEAAGDIKPREKAILADLERDLKAVQKARDTLGDKAPLRPSYSQHPRDRREGTQSTLGKRRHNGERKGEAGRDVSGSDTDESVRNIPWPRDTPPPIPKEFRRHQSDTTKLGTRSSQAPTQPASARTTYESAPQLRDLKKEAVSMFVPNVVKRKQEAIKGSTGQLLEPEDLDRLEREGYIQAATDGSDAPLVAAHQFSEYRPKQVNEMQRLKAEEEAFEKELSFEQAGQNVDEFRHEQAAMQTRKRQPEIASASILSRHVEMEEVEDEDL